MSPYSGVNFSVYRDSQGYAKRLHVTAWTTVRQQFSLPPPPFCNCMGKGVICFSPLKLLPAPTIYTGGDHKLLSNV